MGKLIRFVGWLVGLAVVAIVGLSIALPILLDPNDYKEKITDIVQKKTGRELTIGGDIGLTVFPWLGLELAGVRLSNAEGFGAAPFAVVDTAKIRVKLLPLLRKEVEMGTIVLDGLQLNLAKSKAGKTNWDDLVSADAKTGSGETSLDDALPIYSLAVSGVQLKDTQITWDDRSTGARYVVSDLDLTTGALALETPLDADLSFTLESTEPKVTANIEVSASVWASSSMQVFRVQQLRTKIRAQGEGLPGGKLDAELATKVDLDLEKQQAKFSGLGLTAAGLQLDGSLNASAILGEKPTFSGVIDVQQFAPKEVMQTAGLEPPVTADATVLGKADGHFEFAGDSNSVQANKFRLRFDDTEVTGSFGVRNFSVPAIQFDVALDTLDLDRYLPSPEGGIASATPAQGSAVAAELLPVETIRGLNLSGSLKIGSLKAFGIRSSNIEMKVQSRNGKLRVHPASAKLYQGTYKGDITIDASSARPKLSMSESVKKIQVGELLKDVSGEEPLSGVADITLKLSSVGNSISSLQKGLHGNATFSFKDGAVKGVNIAKVIREGKARFDGKPIPKDAAPNKTDFSELKGTAVISNGVVSNDDLTGQSPLLRLAGKGSIDLVKESIDYLLTVKLVGSLEGQGGQGLSVLKGVAIPVRVGGTFSKPTYRPDLEAALGGIVKEKIDKKKEEVRQKVEEKIEEKLKDKLGDQLQDQLKGGLKGLF